MAKGKGIVLPGTRYGFDGKPREPLNFNTENWEYVYEWNPSIHGDIEDYEEGDLELADAWGLQAPSQRCKHKESEVLASDVEQFLANGGEIKHYEPHERSGVFDDD